MIIDALESGKAEWTPPAMPATMKEVVEAYEEQSAGMPRRWAELPASVGRALEFSAPAARVADGLELPLRHRAPPRADHDIPAPDGIDRSQIYGPSGDEP